MGEPGIWARSEGVLRVFACWLRSLLPEPNLPTRPSVGACRFLLEHPTLETSERENFYFPSRSGGQGRGGFFMTQKVAQ